MVKKNSCVFISGNGTNLRALLNFSRNYNFPIKINLIISSKSNAIGLIYAKKNSIPFKIINSKDRLSEVKMLKIIKEKKIELICLAGYMKILSKNFIRRYNGKIINIHPSLLPKFKGLNTFEKVLNTKEKRTGCTVHFVSEKLDSGKIISKKFFDIVKSDNVKTLKFKTQKLEYKAFSQAIIKIYQQDFF